MNQQQQQGRKNAVVGLREKRVSEDKRSTTPYMTKYEKARVLGTRALQIRYVTWGLGSSNRSGPQLLSKAHFQSY